MVESNRLARVGWWAFKIELRPIHVFRTTLETELKMRVGGRSVRIFAFHYSDGFGCIVVSAFVRLPY